MQWELTVADDSSEPLSFCLVFFSFVHFLTTSPEKTLLLSQPAHSEKLFVMAVLEIPLWNLAFVCGFFLACVGRIVTEVRLVTCVFGAAGHIPAAAGNTALQRVRHQKETMQGQEPRIVESR